MVAKKYRRPKSPPFTMLDHEIWKSIAWKELKGSAIRVYIVFRDKAFGRFDEARKKLLKVSYTEIRKETGLAISSIREAIIQLENIGFLDFVEQGGLNYRRNGYKLSTRFLKLGRYDFEKGSLKKQRGVSDRGFGLHRKWRNSKTKETTTTDQRERVKNKKQEQCTIYSGQTKETA